MRRDAWTADGAAGSENYWVAACVGPSLLTTGAYWGTAYAVSGSGGVLLQLLHGVASALLTGTVVAFAAGGALRRAVRVSRRVARLPASRDAEVCVGFAAAAMAPTAAAVGIVLATGGTPAFWLGPLPLPAELAAQAAWGWVIGRAAVGPGRAAWYPGWGNRGVRSTLLAAGGIAVAVLVVGGYRFGEARLGARVAAEDRLVALTTRVGGTVTRAGGGPFRVVTAVDLSGSRVTDADVPALAGLDTVESLDLSRTAVSGAGLDRVLAGMPRLRRLNLAETRVTDDTVTAIGPHPRLEDLDLSDTPLTDRAAAGPGLLRSQYLRLLQLGGTRVTWDTAGRHLSRPGLRMVVGDDTPEPTRAAPP